MAVDEKERGFISPDMSVHVKIFRSIFQDHIRVPWGNLWFVGTPHNPEVVIPPCPKTSTRNESHSL